MVACAECGRLGEGEPCLPSAGLGAGLGDAGLASPSPPPMARLSPGVLQSLVLRL